MDLTNLAAREASSHPESPLAIGTPVCWVDGRAHVGKVIEYYPFTGLYTLKSSDGNTVAYNVKRENILLRNICESHKF